jgi:hypothetical protein
MGDILGRLEEMERKGIPYWMRSIFTNEKGPHERAFFLVG